MEKTLSIKNIEKYYGNKGNIVKAIDDISFDVFKGEFVGVMGPSGSGKTTLLNTISTIDEVSAGHIYINEKDLTEITLKEIAKFRRENLGFIFQDFNLLDTLTIHENIALALTINRTKKNEIDSRVADVAKELGIEDILSKYPYEVSGGQKQRAAVARALITHPKLVLADEPTGALDSKSSTELLNLFSDINSAGQTIVMVTHSTKAASHASRVLFIKDGKLFHQIYRGAMNNDDMYQKISDSLTVLTTGGAEIE